MERQDTELRWEAVFREQMAALRNGQDISQTTLAERLRGRGLAFHQQTVAKIESGDRPVRLDEAYAIAEELGSSVERMVRGVADVSDLLKESSQEVQTAYQQVKDSTMALVSALGFLEMHIQEERRRGRLRPEDYVMPTAFLNYTPVDAVQAGLAQLVADRAADEIVSRYTPDSQKLDALVKIMNDLLDREDGDGEHRSEA